MYLNGIYSVDTYNNLNDWLPVFFFLFFFFFFFFFFFVFFLLFFVVVVVFFFPAALGDKILHFFQTHFDRVFFSLNVCLLQLIRTIHYDCTLMCCIVQKHFKLK